MNSVQVASIAESVKSRVPTGMHAFVIIWLGQLISLIGSSLTSFALGVWIYEQTGRATPFALTALFGSLPNVLLSPLAGALADRWNRRRIMILADTGAALATLFAAAMILTGQLQIWHIYLVALFSSIFGAFQQPAYMASVTMLVPKKDLGRASGMTQGSQAAGMLIAPILAGFLFFAVGLKGIVLIDFATFLFAISALLLVHIPQPKSDEAKGEVDRSLLKDVTYGWTYLRARAGLLVMLIYFALVNFLINISGVLTAPLVLSFADVRILGVIQAIFGVAMLVGSVVMSAWGGPKRKMRGVYIFIALFGLGFIIAGLQPSAWLIGLGSFVIMASLPIAAGSSQALWQSKVEPDVQGRVFAIRAMVAQSMMPLAFLLAGPLADGVFNPLLVEGGPLAATVGQLIGVGQGRGIGLIYILAGLLLLLVTAAAYAYPRVRLIEDELPDVIPDLPAEAHAEG